MLRGLALLGFSLPALLLVPACGARTQLDLPEPCTHPEQTRPCGNQCGPGTETCAGGYWGSCVVPVATRGCTNDCGSGTQECRDNAWQSCDVSVATRGCTNDCGSGTQTCQNGAWQTACAVPVAMRDCSSVCGSGHETCENGTWGACDAPQPKPPTLVGRIRDFHRTQPDFEEPDYKQGDDPGMVEDTLGDDDKPVYARPGGTTRTTDGQANFDVWWRDAPPGPDPVNEGADLLLQLQASPDEPGLFVYDDRSFFPIDDQLFGDEGFPHNYHFTLEVHTSFLYHGGEIFSFAGDDDMWVFINRKLAIDLGGTHVSEGRDLTLDAIANEFGLTIGQEYSLAFFFAERHTIDSDFTVRTTIASAGSCP